VASRRQETQPKRAIARIRKLCALLAWCCLLGTSHAVSAFESRGARTCTAWQEYRQDEKAGINDLNSQIYQTWVFGYLSGIVAGSGMDFLSGTDNETVSLMIDAYCEANPGMNLAGAGTFVARQLMQQKGIINRPTLP